MANTLTTTTVLNHTTTAGFNAWVVEVIASIFGSGVGLTQTSDTGQTTNGGSSVPGVGLAGGYVIGRFNDTAQSTSPIFFKLEFGTSTTSAVPQMWITVGTGSNGSGTITGTTTARSSVNGTGAVISTVTSYASRYIYNPTLGYFGLFFKQGSTGTGACNSGGIVLSRSNNSSGTVTTDAYFLITNSTSSSGVAASPGVMQCYSYLTSALISLPTNNGFGAFPFGLTTTTVSGQIQLAPLFYAAPIVAASAYIGGVLTGELPVGNTITLALVGSTPVTVLGVGAGAFGGASVGSGVGYGLTPGANFSYASLWQ
jgi:hypothetical protein